MRVAANIARLRAERPLTWLWVTQAIPILAVGFGAAFALARRWS